MQQSCPAKGINSPSHVLYRSNNNEVCTGFLQGCESKKSEFPGNYGDEYNLFYAECGGLDYVTGRCVSRNKKMFRVSAEPSSQKLSNAMKFFMRLNGST